MPFLHPPTFLKPLRHASTVPPPAQDFGPPTSTSNVLPPYSPMLLLAFLALTARYHPQLVAHHSPPSSQRPSNPKIASEYYAAAAKSRLAGNLGDGLGTPEIERVQALMMLALFGWGRPSVCTNPRIAIRSRAGRPTLGAFPFNEAGDAPHGHRTEKQESGEYQAIGRSN